jgi:two-component system LytT family response regulator
MKIRTLIVDDVALARQRVRRYLDEDPEIEVVGECSNGREAVAAVLDLAPDLVFLDVQMPELDGFQVVQALEGKPLPAVIFLTAYDEYTLRAFEVHALDYLLKPFEPERLRRAVAHAKAQIGKGVKGRGVEAVRALLSDLGAKNKYPRRLTVKTGGRTVIVAADAIDYIKAEGNYLRIKAGGEAHLMRERLGRIETVLDPRTFVRIHRSTIVNIERIKEMQPLFNGDQALILRDGTRLTASRSYRDNLMSRLG